MGRNEGFSLKSILIIILINFVKNSNFPLLNLIRKESC